MLIPHRHPRARRFRTGLACATLCMLGTLAGVGAAPVHQDGGTTREQAALAEEQELLRRQVRQLTQTMEALAGRFETEGRAHAAQLLRGALAHLTERNEEAGSLTLDELMGASGLDLTGGRAGRALEEQRRILASLERLLAILLDRQDLDSLEASLEELQDIRRRLGELADSEARLEEKTEALEDEARNESLVDLSEGINLAVAEQRMLLADNENQSRASGTLDLDRARADLEALLRRQVRDADLFRAWDPSAARELHELRPALEEARREATRAKRLAAAAEALRLAAAGAREAGDDALTGQAAAEDLAQAAEREERRARASADPAAQRAARALREGADELEAAGGGDARREAADSLEESARQLAVAAGAAQQKANRAAEAARNQARAKAAGEGAAALAASEVAGALDRGGEAAAGADSSQTDRIEEALQALERGLRESGMLGPALAASQAHAQATAQGLARDLAGLRSLPDPLRAGAAAAAKALEAAAISLGKASGQAAEGQAAEGQASAQAALEALSEAARALGAAGAGDPTAGQPSSGQPSSGQPSSGQPSSGQPSSGQPSSGQPSSGEPSSGQPSSGQPSSGQPSSGQPSSGQAGDPQPSATSDLSQRQEDLARDVDDLAEGAREANLDAGAREDVEEALRAATRAMEEAARALERGRSASAASSQRDALEALARASSATEEGVQASGAAAERAQQLREEQEKIREEILRLAERNRERDSASPQPDMEGAANSAGQASESLGSGNLGGARQKERETEQRLRQAMEQLDEEEEQYERLRQEELLFRIAEEAQALLESHQEQMARTVALDSERAGDSRPGRSLRLRLREVARQEAALSERAEEAARAIREEESLVFAEILSEVARDLARVGRDLGDGGGYQSGERVQALQRDVERSLGWLLEALRQEQQRRSESPPRPASSSGMNRLVPDAAELKLLRRMEVELLGGIEEMQILHPELAAGGGVGEGGAEIDPLVLEDVARLAYRHQRISDLFEQFRSRLGIPAPSGDTEKDESGNEPGGIRPRIRLPGRDG